jgi:hypothetical protein
MSELRPSRPDPTEPKSVRLLRSAGRATTAPQIVGRAEPDPRTYRNRKSKLTWMGLKRLRRAPLRLTTEVFLSP